MEHTEKLLVNLLANIDYWTWDLFQDIVQWEKDKTAKEGSSENSNKNPKSRLFLILGTVPAPVPFTV